MSLIGRNCCGYAGICYDAVERLGRSVPLMILDNVFIAKDTIARGVKEELVPPPHPPLLLWHPSF